MPGASGRVLTREGLPGGVDWGKLLPVTAATPATVADLMKLRRSIIFGCSEESFRWQLSAVGGAGDEGGGVGCAEAVVDVDDGDVRRAGVEHAEEGCGAGEGGSVADRGRDGDDGDADEAADD